MSSYIGLSGHAEKDGVSQVQTVFIKNLYKWFPLEDERVMVGKDFKMFCLSGRKHKPCLNLHLLHFWFSSFSRLSSSSYSRITISPPRLLFLAPNTSTYFCISRPYMTFLRTQKNINNKYSISEHCNQLFTELQNMLQVLNWKLFQIHA